MTTFDDARRNLRTADDEWPAVDWYSAMPGPLGDVRGVLAEGMRLVRDRGRTRRKLIGERIWILAQRGPGDTWEASIVYVSRGRRYWRPRGLHPTLRAALRDLRRHLAWEIAGAVRDEMLMPDATDWTAVARLTAVARRWAA